MHFQLWVVFQRLNHKKKGLALGAQAGPTKLFKILENAGFKTTKIVKKNATNMVIMAEK